MYITDAKHFLDEKGAIAARRGSAKVMTDLHAGLIAAAITAAKHCDTFTADNSLRRIVVVCR